MQNNDIVKQINTYAMQNGLILGGFGIVSLFVLRWSFSMPSLSFLFTLMLFGSFVLAAKLTFKIRNEIAGKDGIFNFFQGFLHTFFMGFYASVLIAVFVFVYLRYFDYGAIFAAYGHSIDTPEMRQYLMQSGVDAQIAEMTGEHGVQGLVHALQCLGAATYASMSLYSSIIIGPLVSIIIGLLCRCSNKTSV